MLAPRAGKEAVVSTVWPADKASCTAYCFTAPPTLQVRTFSSFGVGSEVGEGKDKLRRMFSAATAFRRGKESRTACFKGVALILSKLVTECQ